MNTDPPALTDEQATRIAAWMSEAEGPEPTLALASGPGCPVEDGAGAVCGTLGVAVFPGREDWIAWECGHTRRILDPLAYEKVARTAVTAYVPYDGAAVAAEARSRAARDLARRDGVTVEEVLAGEAWEEELEKGTNAYLADDDEEEPS